MTTEDDEKTDKRSWRDRIVRAALLVALAHFLVKIVSLVQNRYLGHYFTEEEGDFFLTLFKYVFLSIFLIGEETLGPIFLPIFMKIRQQAGEAMAWRFSSMIFNVYFLLLLALGIVMIIDPQLVIRIWTQWHDDPTGNADKLQLADRTVPLLVPGLIGMCLGSLTYLLLNARERFFWAAWGDGMVKICILIGIIVGGVLYTASPDRSTFAANGLVIATVGLAAGGLAKFACHLWALARTGALHNFRLTLTANRQYVKDFLLLLLPLLVGILFAKFRDGFNYSWILSDQPGLVRANAFGKTIADSIHYLVPYAVAIALLPYFCMLAANREDSKFAEILNNATRALLFLFVPISLIIIVVAFPLTRGFYETGKFTLESSRLTAVACAFFASGLAFASLEAVFMQAFFSRRSIWTPILIGMACSALSIGISYVGIVRLQASNPFHILGIVSGGYVFSRALKSVVLGIVLQQRTRFFDAQSAGNAAKAVVLGGTVALVAALGFSWAADAVIENISIAGKFFEALPKSLRYLALSGAIAGSAFCVFFFASCRCRLQEPRWLYEWSIEKYPPLRRLKLDRIFFGESIG
ncbi:MAG: lipid II flippase MurJ [Lentisphaeria bacterium]|nr:lipid II flippase MurJ [Lentisphaeria bacterium]